MTERALGPYQLLAQLAVGGMAEIYVAKTAGVGGFEKLIALKVIHPNYSEDPEFVQMLVDEAKLAVQLQHANIVQTFDLGRIDEQYYIAMELIDGIDLYRLLRQASEKEIDFPFEVAAHIAHEVSSGLDYAHRKRDPQGRPLEIVHRDVSPQNVLVSYDGEVKLVDFGIAKAALRGQKTAAGVIKGKYYYMSPEQAWGDPIDARSDVFSTGILLYEMLVGQMLYLEEDLDVLLDRVRKADIPPPTMQRAGVPPELEQMVMRALRKRAADRFQSAGELALALGKFIRGFQPDFNRARLASFVQQVLGDEPTTKNRDPRARTALRREMLERDENSLIFKLSDLEAPAPKGTPPRARDQATAAPARARDQPAAPAPRARDQATSPVSLPELARAIPPASRPPAAPPAARPSPRPSGDFEESDATIVDGGGETLLAQLGGPGRAPQPVAIPRSEDPAFDAPAPAASATNSAGGPEGDDDEDEETLNGGAAPPAALAGLAGPPRELPTTPRGHVQVKRFDSLADEHTNVGDDAPEEEETRQRKLPPPRNAEGVAVAKVTLEMRRPRLPPELSGAGAQARPVPPRAAPAVPPPSARPPVASAPPGSPEPGRFDDPFDEQSTVPPIALPAPAALPAPPPLPAPVEPARTSPPPLPGPPAWPFQPFDGAPAQGGVDLDATATPSTVPEAFPAAPRPPDLSSTLLVKSPRALFYGGGIVLALIALAVTIGLLMAGGGPARASIEVVSLPPGAEVRLDGNRASGTTPLVIPDVDAQSTHRVRVSLRGYDVWEDDVKLDSSLPRNASVRVQAVLVPTVGTLELASSPPGAEAIVNGRIRGTTPTTVGDLPPNEDVAIELRLRGYRVAREALPWPKDGDGRHLKVTIPLEKAR